ncbi:hypothetical protein F5148DRAFT_977386 [Russula earlei]|uniref:Uncharacterized protein n=1 Tax=Russula earlei TaxID=71964 RepID=A0ACC0UEN9_9AGAM|nr:hypothetical protein F5148DRAFT_977386 [Russula earlei]
MYRCSRSPVLPAVSPTARTPLSLPKRSTGLGNGLPNELLDTIFDHLSRDALTRVALVSRRWRANAERLLYFRYYHPRSPASRLALAYPTVPATTLRCCETLSARPHLAEYVRRFHVRWETDAVESPLLLLCIAQNIARSLVPMLVHLDSLELSFGLAPHLPAFNVALTGINSYPPFASPSLRTLALHGIGEPPELERVLRSHPALLHLRLGDYHRALRLEPADVPHLRSFRGYPATAASILPGRPVQVLSLVGGELATEEDLAHIATGSVPVRSLDLSGMSVTPRLLRTVSRHLSHVEWLKVRLALRHTLHYALSGIRLLTALTTVLAAFYNLRDLDLSPTSAVQSDGQNAVEEERLCVTWMGACPSLRRIIFPSLIEWSLSEAGTWISRCHLGASRRVWSRRDACAGLPSSRLTMTL